MTSLARIACATVQDHTFITCSCSWCDELGLVPYQMKLLTSFWTGIFTTLDQRKPISVIYDAMRDTFVNAVCSWVLIVVSRGSSG